MRQHVLAARDVFVETLSAELVERPAGPYAAADIASPEPTTV